MYAKLALAMLADAMREPEARALVEKMLTDDRLNKRDIFELGFTQGVVSTVAAADQGRLFTMKENPNRN